MLTQAIPATDLVEVFSSVQGEGELIGYRQIFIRFPDCNLEETLQRMVQRRCGTVYVHCSLGRDRTGLIAALYRYRYLGWSPQRAFCEMQRGEFNSRLVELDDYFWCSVNRSAAVPLSE